MKIVLELGDWVLAEDDAGEVRLWSNGVTGETRSYEDVPPEVQTALASDSGPPPVQPDVPAPRQDAQPFKRATGLASVPTANPASFSAEAAGGLAAAQRQPDVGFPSTLQPSQLAYTADAAPAEYGWPPEGQRSWEEAPAEHGWPPEGQRSWEEADPRMPKLEKTAALQGGAAYPDGAVPQPSMEMSEAVREPDPVIEKPAHLVDLPPREPPAAMLVKATTMKSYQGQSQEQFLSKLTHLHLAEKGLTSMGKAFHLCHKLKVLNLERNHLQELNGVHVSCEALHLQGNDIWDLSGWTQNLPNLTNLELAENRLQALSGLHRCNQLEVLGMRGQRSDVPLLLHAPTLRAFSRSLRCLDISRNRMGDTEIGPVASLRMLERLDASSNMLTDMQAVGAVLQPLFQLQKLNLTENPVCWTRKYRDMVIVSAGQSLTDFDGKAVQPNERPFLIELHQRRRRRSSSVSSVPGELGGDSPSNRSGSTPTAPRERGQSVPRPPRDQVPPPAPMACVGAQRRSRSSSVDPAARHYRRRSSATAKLPPLLPRI